MRAMSFLSGGSRGTARVAWPLCAAFIVGSAGCYEEPLEVDYAAQGKTPPAAAELPDRLPEVVVDEDGYATLSGQVKNWLSLQYVDGVEVSSVGLTPPASGASAGAQGEYSVPEVQVAGVFWLKAYKAGYQATYEYVRMPQGDYPNKTAYIISDADLTALATAYGKTPLETCGTILAEVKNLANQGAAGIAGVTLSGVDYEGPYFLNAQGQPEGGTTETTASGRVVFFNVCSPGVTSVAPNTIAQLSVDEPGYVVASPQYLNVYADGVTRGAVQVDDTGAPPPPPPPPPDEIIDFTTHIQPIIVREACAACHAVGGAAAGTGLYLNGTPSENYALLKEGTARVNLAYPQQSLLLQKPLYEDPPNHPNASFPSVDHPDYVTVLNWIQQGAPYGDEVPPPPPPVVDLPQNVDFFTNVQSRFAQRTCTGCHNATTYAAGMDLTGTPQDVYARLYNVEQRVVPNNYEGSYLYTKPNATYLDVVHSGGKPVANGDDDFARYVAGWIYEGAPAYVTPLVPMSATADLAPLFQAQGCTGCHNEAGQANYGNLRLDLTGQNLVDELNGVYDGDNDPRVTAYEPENSPIAMKWIDLYPNVNHTGGKKQINTYYKEYHRLVTWIYEGADEP